MELKYGKVSETKPGFVKVNLTDLQIVTKWIPVVMLQTAETKRLYSLGVNTFVACLMDCNGEEGVCLGGIYSKSNSAPQEIAEGVVYPDGAVINYDPQAGELTVTGVKKIVIESSGEVAISCSSAKISAQSTEITAPLNTINGALTVSGVVSVGGLASAAPGGGPVTFSGDIETSGEISASDVKAGLISLKDHKHLGVTTGGSISGIPTP